MSVFFLTKLGTCFALCACHKTCGTTRFGVLEMCTVAPMLGEVVGLFLSEVGSLRTMGGPSSSAFIVLSGESHSCWISGVAPFHSFHFLTLSETYTREFNTSNFASAFTFSLSPHRTGRGGTALLPQTELHTSIFSSVSSSVSFKFHCVVVIHPTRLHITVLKNWTSSSVHSQMTAFHSILLGDFILPNDELHTRGILKFLSSYGLA